MLAGSRCAFLESVSRRDKCRTYSAFVTAPSILEKTAKFKLVSIQAMRSLSSRQGFRRQLASPYHATALDWRVVDASRRRCGHSQATHHSNRYSRFRRGEKSSQSCSVCLSGFASSKQTGHGVEKLDNVDLNFQADDIFCDDSNVNVDDIDRGSVDWRIVDWSKVEITTNRDHRSPPHDERQSVATIEDLIPTVSPDFPSPVEMVIVRDRIIYVKRDDLLRLRSSNVSGNKARKMLALNEMSPDDFPDCIVSYGGPQSNAMLAIAAIVHSKNVDLCQNDSVGTACHDYSCAAETDMMRETSNISREDATAILSLGDKEREKERGYSMLSRSVEGRKRKKKRFVYYTKKLPRYLRKQPNGNLLRALSLGMEIVELSPIEYRDLFGGDYGGSPVAPHGLRPPVPGNSVWIPQGGACGVAIAGARFLADEIVSFWTKQGRGMPLSVCLPGGTCTTALLLHREIQSILHGMREETGESGTAAVATVLDIQVVAIPCVGDDEYAQRQMTALDANTGGTGQAMDIPTVLLPSSNNVKGGGKRHRGYFSFGEPSSAILKIFQEMKEYGVYLDLMYGAPAWCLLLQHWKTQQAADGEEDVNSCPIAGRQVMYLHSGGLEGISSQLTRYKHKGLLHSLEIQ